MYYLNCEILGCQTRVSQKSKQAISCDAFIEVKNQQCAHGKDDSLGFFCSYLKMKPCSFVGLTWCNPMQCTKVPFYPHDSVILSPPK